MTNKLMITALMLVPAASWAQTIPTAVPEPNMLALLALGAAGLALIHKRKK